MLHVLHNLSCCCTPSISKVCNIGRIRSSPVWSTAPSSMRGRGHRGRMPGSVVAADHSANRVKKAIMPPTKGTAPWPRSQRCTPGTAKKTALGMAISMTVADTVL